METEDTEDSVFLHHAPCPDCGSSDALSVYSDGHTWCFACEKHTRGEDDEGETKAPSRKKALDLIQGEFRPLKARGITEETCRRFDYRVAKRKGELVHIANYRKRSTNEIVAQHLRTKDKDFPWVGQMKDAGLFGMHLWKEGGKRVVVTEGELDAMSLSQLQDHKWPVVSIKSGASAAYKDFKENSDWLETFDEVVILFDMDEPGQKAAKECAAILSPNKAKIAQLPLKDANDMLMARRGSELINAIWQAATYRPDFMLSVDELWSKVNQEITEGYSLPWAVMSSATYGVRLHEIWTLLAGSGMGKTEVFKELAVHMAKEHGLKSACIFLEEQPHHTALCLAGKHVNKRLHKPDGDWTEEERKEGFDEIIRSEKVLIHNHQGNSEFEDILRAIIYYVQAHGCSFIFLDHVTAMAEGKGEDNVNGRIHYIMEELNKLTQRLPLTIFIISHIRKNDKNPAEEGGRVKADDAYGSGAIKQRSNFIFALERDQQAERVDNKDYNTFRCLKDRNIGQAAGLTTTLSFDHATGRLLEDEARVDGEDLFADDDETVPF